MPVVPMFQGGVPQVGASVTPTTVVHAPQPTVDYERLMRFALEPLKLGVDSVQKMQAQDEARQIKSLSDEAETAYMKAVQERMYNPETGYMIKRGKDAHDSYQGTVDGLQKDADDILSKLSPYVRDAVQSRINDRLTTAQGNALRWNAQQTQAWHIESSGSRIESLTQDGAQHYGDTDYLAKTWLSIAKEVEYQATLRGWDDETKKLQMQAHYDSFMANRFSTWSNDDAVGAFEAAQGERKHMSTDVWGKLDAALWGASKQEIALRLSQMVPPLRSKKDIASVVLDRNKRCGWPVVDNLTPARKAEVYSAAWGYMERIRSEGQASLKRAVENSLSLAGDEGTDPNPLSEDQFVAAYGDEDGKLAYQDYQSNLALRENIFRFNGLSNNDIAETLNGMRPQRGSENYAVQSKNWRQAQKAAAVVLEARQKDPVGSAVQDAKYGLAPITDWSSEAVTAQLVHRAKEADQIASDYGTRPAVLTESEADSLVEYIGKLPPIDQGIALVRVAKGLGDDGMIGVLGAQLGPKNARLGTACYLMSDDESAGLKYLKGMQYVDEKRVTFPMTGEGSRGEIMRLLGDEEGAAGITSNPQVLSTMADAVQGLWAYGQENVHDGPTSLDAAVKQAVGQIETWNGRKIVTPKRKDGDYYEEGALFAHDFNDLIADAGKRISKQKGEIIAEGKPWTMRYFGWNLKNMQLQSINNSRYYVIDSTGSYVIHPDGSRFVLDLSLEVNK